MNSNWIHLAEREFPLSELEITAICKNSYCTFALQQGSDKLIFSITMYNYVL